ncbi:hypothetical protein Q8F55_003087 [Vanrija albida]|uniref:Uncharacterized protein n=1 Tax=Vanrija albida TaxID=181172 RepID=A0ABR3QBJ7_9TREE
MLARTLSSATRAARTRTTITTPTPTRTLCSFPPGPLCRPNADTTPAPSAEQEAFERTLRTPKAPGEPEGLTPEAALNELVRQAKAEGVFATEDVNPITGQWQNTALRGRLRSLFRSKAGSPAPAKEE